MSKTKSKISQYQDATRFISGNGVTINADNTKFDIQVVGEIYDPITQLRTDINVNLTAQTTTYLTTQVESYVWVDSTGTVIQSLTPPSPMLFDTIVGYWVLIHSNLTNINVINSFPYYADGTAIKFAQLMSYIGFSKFPGTNIASPGTTGTRISHTGGNAIRSGLGNTTKRPVASLIGGTDVTIEMRHRNGVQTSGIQDIDVDNYNPTGSTVSALNNNKFSVCKVWKFASGLVRVQYGQYEYANFAEALARFQTDSYVDEGNASRNGMHIGWIIFKKGTTWDSGVSGTDYLFIDVTNGRASSSLTPTMQSVYEISTPSAEITTNSTNGAITIKGGTGSNTDKNIESKNNTGTVTFSVDGNGLIIGNGIDLTNVVVSEQKDTSDSSTLTGNTNNTLMKSFLIPANTFRTNDWVQCGARFSKTGTAGQLTNRIYVNTSNSLSGATLLGTQTNGATALSTSMERNLGIKSATSTRTITTTASFSSDFPGSFTGASEVNINIDWTIAQYIIFASQLANGSDSVICTWGFIHKH